MTQRPEVDLDNLVDVVWNDLAHVQRTDGSLLWRQDKFSPWWQKLGYGSEAEARSYATIEREEDVRDYRVLVSETPNFYVKYVQGSFAGITHPQGFHEALEFVLKKASWRGRLHEDVPEAYMFFDKSQFTQGQIDYFSSPRFTLERHIGFDSANIELKSEGFFKDLDGRNIIHEIPEAEKLIRTLVIFSNNDDIMFNGKGREDGRVRFQMKDFKRNLEAAYGIATAQCGSGIIVTSYHYGT